MVAGEHGLEYQAPACAAGGVKRKTHACTTLTAQPCNESWATRRRSGASRGGRNRLAAPQKRTHCQPRESARLKSDRLLGDAAYLPVFKADQLQTLARLQLSSSYDAYYVGLPLWGLTSMVCSYLWLRSRYIPRLLATFGLISSGWCVFCAFAFIIFPHFSATVNASWFDVPLVLFEIVLGLWLLIKGLSPSGLAGHDMASS